MDKNVKTKTMIKKIVIILIAATLFSFTTNDEKKLKVEMTLQSWDKHFSKLQAVRNYVDASNLPHADVKFITGTIDSLLMDLGAQLRLQLDTTKKK